MILCLLTLACTARPAGPTADPATPLPGSPGPDVASPVPSAGSPAPVSSPARAATPPAGEAPAREFEPDDAGYLGWADLQAETFRRRGMVQNILVVSLDPNEIWVAGESLNPDQARDLAGLLCRSFTASFPGQSARIRVYQPYPDQIAERTCP